MELKYPENINEIINGIYYRFSYKFGLNYRSQPVFFLIYTPFLSFYPPPKKKNAFYTYSPSNFTFFTVGTI